MAFENLRRDRVKCPRCGKTGCLVWDSAVRKKSRNLVQIDGDFYERMSKKPPYAIELVCEGCGALQRVMES